MTNFILIILDGFGLREESRGNAYKLANTPEIDRLLNKCSMVPIDTSGRFVGLPEGIMGNSEVGHMNIGAGRVVYQDLVKINKAYLVGFACIIDRSNEKDLIDKEIISQIKFKITTYTKDNLPDDIRNIKAEKPGSRNLSKWAKLDLE